MGKLIVALGVICSVVIFWFGATLAGTPYLTQTSSGSFIALETLFVWFIAMIVLLS